MGNNILKTQIESSIKDPGLGNIFMQSIGITRLFNPNTGTLSKSVQEKGGVTAVGTPIKIVIIGITSIIIMITAALSFFLASLAFIVRFVILLFLLAFSPLVFAASVVPKIDEYAKKWTTMLTNQLIFMPAYLLLMYFALSVMTSSSIFKNGYAGSLVAGGGFEKDLLAIGVNAALIIIMLNLPLLAAMSLGAIMPGFAKNLGADAIWKKVGGWTGGFAGRNTIGWAGGKLDKSLANTRVGNSMVGRSLRSVTTGAAAKAKFGSSTSYEDKKKLQDEIDKESGLIRSGNTAADKARKAAQKTKDLEAVIKSGTTSPLRYRDIIKTMNEKEKLALGGKNLMNKEVLKHLKKSDFEAIKKSDDISDEDKAKISSERMEALRETITEGPSQAEFVEHMVKNMDTDDIMKLESVYLEDENLIAHLTAGQLKKMANERLDADVKYNIGETILNWAGNPISGGNLHHAYGFVNKNRAQWSRARAIP